jgi:mannose-6-phosphate isomerase-like protein (cupin superfamily)
MTIDKIYRHVTGYGPTGEAIFTVSGAVEADEVAFQPGTRFWRLWGTDDDGAVVGANSDPVITPFFPGGHGTRFMVVQHPPDTPEAWQEARGHDELEALRRDAEERLPGLFDAHATTEGTTATHGTDTVDYILVLEGELHLELDEGREVILRPGHFVVQRGTRHRWINKSNRPATTVGVQIAARRLC